MTTQSKLKKITFYPDEIVDAWLHSYAKRRQTSVNKVVLRAIDFLMIRDSAKVKRQKKEKGGAKIK